MKRTYTEIGKFEITSGKMLVTDPTYNKDIGPRCAGILEVQNGVYKAFISRKKFTYTFKGEEIKDERVDVIAIRRCGSRMPMSSIDDIIIDEKDNVIRWTRKWGHQDFTVGVDAGCAGFFDYGKYQEDKDGWMDKLEAALSDSENAGIIDNIGAVSNSGFGDGAYDCFVRLDESGTVVMAAIVFC